MKAHWGWPRCPGRGGPVPRARARPRARTRPPARSPSSSPAAPAAAPPPTYPQAPPATPNPPASPSSSPSSTANTTRRIGREAAAAAEQLQEERGREIRDWVMMLSGWQWQREPARIVLFLWWSGLVAGVWAARGLYTMGACVMPVLCAARHPGQGRCLFLPGFLIGAGSLGVDTNGRHAMARQRTPFGCYCLLTVDLHVTIFVSHHLMAILKEEDYCSCFWFDGPIYLVRKGMIWLSYISSVLCASKVYEQMKAEVFPVIVATLLDTNTWTSACSVLSQSYPKPRVPFRQHVRCCFQAFDPTFVLAVWEMQRDALSIWEFLVLCGVPSSHSFIHDQTYYYLFIAMEVDLCSRFTLHSCFWWPACYYP